MAINVESGTGTSSIANSYVSKATVTTYSANRGVTIAADDTNIEAQIIEAADFLESIADERYVGQRTNPDTQPMAWPRVGAFVRGRIVDSDEIPKTLTNCQCELVLDIRNGIDIHNRSFRIPVKKEKVDGAVEVEYAAREVGAAITDTQATRLLRQLTVGGFGVPIIPSRGGF